MSEVTIVNAGETTIFVRRLGDSNYNESSEGTAPGEYPIVEDEPFDAGDNYEITFVAGAMTILPRIKTGEAQSALPWLVLLVLLSAAGAALTLRKRRTACGK